MGAPYTDFPSINEALKTDKEFFKLFIKLLAFPSLICILNTPFNPRNEKYFLAVSQSTAEFIEISK